MTDAAQERLEQLEAALERALARLEAGDTAAARTELLAATATEPQPRVAEDEIDAAFEQAAPETDRMLDADSVAHQAIRQVDAEIVADSARTPLPQSFATATMAELLERQGDTDGASRIRSGLGTATAEAAPARPSRQRVIATLESWLQNIRGGARP